MPADREVPENMRKIPMQERAGRTIAAVLEAAAQVLQKHGEPAFTTNRIAEKAGYSIGTLYQYFPNKDAILLALAARERKAIETQIRAALEKARPAHAEAAVREVIRVLVRAFAGRRRVRRVVIIWALRSGRIGMLQQAQGAIVELIVETAARQEDRAAHGLRPLTPALAFVLTRAVQGAIRSAVLEESPLLETPEFEDELVRMAMGLLRADTAPTGRAEHVGAV
jgi:AcrR family transcriptional regulator